MSLQALPPSVLLLIARFLAPALLKHAFRAPGYRAAHRSLVAASSTCHVLRRACFPLAIRVFRNRDREPLHRADIGQSALELERRILWVLERQDLWPHIRMIDIELFARGPCSLAKSLSSLVARLPHLESFAIRLPTYRVFRDALISDLRGCFVGNKTVETLCVDVDSVWLAPLFPNLRELVVWSWPKPAQVESDKAGGWKMFLANLDAQAPNVSELEIGGLSIWDVNEIFPALANGLRDVITLRVLHRSEPYGAISAHFLPPIVQSSVRLLWQDARCDPDYEGQFILGWPGRVKHIVHFGLQDECGSCYVPKSGGWKDVGPVVVLSSEDMRDRS